MRLPAVALPQPSTLHPQVQRLTSEVHQLQLAGSSEATELSQKVSDTRRHHL